MKRLIGVYMDDGTGHADQAAEYWRGKGEKVRVVRRTVSALGLSVPVLVVVVLGPRAARHQDDDGKALLRAVRRDLDGAL